MGNKAHSKIKQHDVRGTRVMDNSISLEWSTSEEQDVTNFTIENVDAQIIGEVDPTGAGSSYSFTDQNASDGHNIYSVRVNFVDGETYYFDPITVE